MESVKEFSAKKPPGISPTCKTNGSESRSKPMIRHKSTFMTFEFARSFVQSNNIRSRYHYEKWWAETKPPLPRAPNRVYKQWKGWNDFLRDNKEIKSFEKTLMNKKRPPRPLWEAIRWSQQIARKHNLNSEAEYKQWIRDNPDQLPSDIPKSPRAVYSDFPGFPVWLGKTAVSKVEAQQHNVSLFVIHHVKGQQPNVIRPNVWKDGYHSMLEKLKDEDYPLGKPYQMFEWESDLQPKVDQILNAHGSQQIDGNYIISNIPQFMWDLSEILLIYSPKKR